MTNCPLCGNNQFCSFSLPHIKCHTYQRECEISSDIIAFRHHDSELFKKCTHLIVEKLLEKSLYNNATPWYFMYDSSGENSYPEYYVNLAEIITFYPETFLEKAHRALRNLSYLYPNFGTKIGAGNAASQYNAMFSEHLPSSPWGIFPLLEDLGYAKLHTSSTPRVVSTYMITAEGWKKIDELNKASLEVKQAFIAMSFREETQFIREAFRTAISDSGYIVRIIDEKEHNNQIVPEIFYEIERSKFVVVDVTYPNYGAYYEAGYAQALHKQVIICCSEDAFKSNENRPNFDISQKSIIVWKDENDLIERLKKRIEATVQ